jgi:hypothetical protein
MYRKRTRFVSVSKSGIYLSWRAWQMLGICFILLGTTAAALLLTATLTATYR